MEFAGKPNLLVFPKVTGRAMSIMREVAGPGSLFIFPKAIIEGEGNGTPLQYSCLENPMDGGAW